MTFGCRLGSPAGARSALPAEGPAHEIAGAWGPGPEGWTSADQDTLSCVKSALCLSSLEPKLGRQDRPASIVTVPRAGP